jgi:transcriptional regulator with XRE-family HTH domain
MPILAATWLCERPRLSRAILSLAPSISAFSKSFIRCQPTSYNKITTVDKKKYMITVDTTHQMTFGQWLKTKRAELRISGGDLETRSGVSRQYISNLERELKQEKSGKPVQPSIEIVDKIAKALNSDIDEARIAAGYAPAQLIGPPRNRKELLEALERIGVAHIEFHDEIDGATPEQLQELFDAVRLAVEITLSRQGKK